LELCKEKSYLINKIMTFSKQQLFTVLENFPNIDLATLLIREILTIDNINEKALNHLIDVVNGIKESTDEFSENSYDTETATPLIMQYDPPIFTMADQSMEFVNQRSATRKSVCMDVNLVRNSESLLEECIDISASGMFVKTREQFSPNEDLTVSMMISHNGIQEELAFESKVVRTPGNGIGIQFNSMDCENRTRLEDLIRNI